MKQPGRDLTDVNTMSAPMPTHNPTLAGEAGQVTGMESLKAECESGFRSDNARLYRNGGGPSKSSVGKYKGK